MSFGLLVTVFASALSLVSLAEARITQLQVVRLESPTFGGMTFGSVGAYEKITARAFGEVDPTLPGNALMTDIQFAPRNARGMVEYSTDVFILKPIDPSKGSGKIFYDVVNRGNKGSYTTFNQAPAPSGVANTDASGAGTGLLMRRGYTIVWSGWEDASLIGTGANTLTASLPVARNPDGSSIVTRTITEQIFDNATGTDVSLTYAAANLDQSQAYMVVHNHTQFVGGPLVNRVTVPTSVWSYVNNLTVRINRADPFLAPYDQGAAFEFVYPAKDPIVLALGFAAWRWSRAREPSRAAADLRRRPAEHRGERPHEPGRDQRDADEEQERADAHSEEPLGDADPVHEEPVEEEADPRCGDERLERRPEEREAARRQLGALTDGRDRRHAGGTDRRADRREERDQRPDDEAHHDRSGREHRGALRQVDPDRGHELVEADGEAEAEEEAGDGRERADDQRLAEHGGHHLATRRADRPQRRELAHPLRDRDRDRVEDDERADEERDAAEAEQDLLDDPDEADVLRLLLHLRAHRPHLSGRRQQRPDLGRELRRRDVPLRGDADDVELADLVEELLRRLEVEDGDRRRADRGHGAELHDPGDGEELLRPARDDADRVARLVVLLVGRGLVDRDLARGGRKG